MLDVSIIIVNWNGQDLLRTCLDAVIATTRQVTYEIIVVDNHSTDGSPAMVKRDYPAVRLVENTDNAGFPRGNNQGIAISQGRYVLLLNSDAFVKANTIDYMVQFMDTHPDAGMSACRLRYGDGTLQPSCMAFPTLETEFYIASNLNNFFPKSPVFGKYMMTHWDYNDTREVDAILGAFMLVRASAIQTVGGMDEGYFMYSEEVDWCYQFKQHGWKIYFVPDVECTHLWGGSSKDKTDKVRIPLHIQLYRSRVRFFRKNYSRVSAIGLKAMIAFNCVIRLGAGLLLGRVHTDKHRANWHLLRALPSL
jgi:GT2 family glycosyltransferase